MSRQAGFKNPARIEADITNDAQDIRLDNISTALTNDASTARLNEVSLETRFVASDVSLTTRVSTEEVNRTAAVSTETARAVSVETVISSALVSTTTRLDDDLVANLSTAKAYADQKITDLVNGAPGILDTLKELSDALGGDGNFATTVANNIAAVSAAVIAEASTARSSELSLESKLSASISSEASTSRAAEVSLETRLTTADTSLTTRVSAETVTRSTADASLTTRVSIETSRALSAELILTTNLSTELVTRASADTSLTTRVSAEEITRSSAISTQAFLLTSSNSTQLIRTNSLAASIVTERTRAVDAELSLESSLGSAIVDEQDRAIAAEDSLTARISVEETLRASGISTAISSEVVARDIAIADAKAQAIASANAFTTGGISTEVYTRAAAISNAVVSANQYTDGAISGLNSTLSAEISTLRVNTAANLATAISDEVSARNAAINTSAGNLTSTFSTNLAAEASTARAAELSLETSISSQIAGANSSNTSALSIEVVTRLAYEAAADIKFDAIREAFDVIFGAIDIEPTPGAGGSFAYDETVQGVASGPAPGPAPAPVYNWVLSAVTTDITGGDFAPAITNGDALTVGFNSSITLSSEALTGSPPTAVNPAPFATLYRLTVNGVAGATQSSNVYYINNVSDGSTKSYVLALLKASDNSVLDSISFTMFFPPG